MARLFFKKKTAEIVDISELKKLVQNGRARFFVFSAYVTNK